MRKVSVVGLVLALQASCSNQNKKTDPPVEQKDASKVESADGAPAVAPAPVTDEQLHKLFSDAVYCPGPCPERDQLRELKRAYPAQVAAVALAIMADPASRTDQGVGLEATFTVEEWLKAGPDEAARKRTSQALARVAAEGSSFMRFKAYELLGHFLLPDAQQILIAEVENPARETTDRYYAARALGGVIGDDFDLIRRWLRDDQPLHWYAALAMMKSFDAFNDGNQPLWDEGRALLVALARRRELPPGVVYELAFFFGIYLDADPKDAEIRALAERWTKHPDDMAAGQMEKILASH